MSQHIQCLKINYENFYKLNTKEDSTFLHKSLGFICLLHFFYRYFLYFYYGSMFFSSSYDLFFINLHGVLSISSFLFHIPSLRNPLKPMIYPEFRLHSIVFALRSIIVCNIYFFHLSYLYIIFTCFVTMISADIITFIYNKEGKNGNTMRNMPFESGIEHKLQLEIVKMQSFMQLGATTFMLGSFETAFSPLFAIQLAAFLMTMVRKSIISTTSWHALYSLSLWLNIGFLTTLSIEYLLLQKTILSLFQFVFFPNKINKYIAWSMVFSFYILYNNIIGFNNIPFITWIDSFVLMLYLKRMLVFGVWANYLVKFKPLFFLKN